MYKNPKTGNKVGIVSPPLSLGSAVHDVLEPLSKLPPDERFSQDLHEKFIEEFNKYKGKIGGFTSDDDFEAYKIRGLTMIENVLSNQQLLLQKTLNLNEDLLSGWLSKEADIKICGKIDWTNIDENTEHLSVIDFKTSKEEGYDDLQLKTYALLLFILNKNPVNSLNYWFLDVNSDLTPVELPEIKEAHTHILDIANKIKQARKENDLKCRKDGCFFCREFEKIASGEGELVSTGKYNTELYFVD